MDIKFGSIFLFPMGSPALYLGDLTIETGVEDYKREATSGLVCISRQMVTTYTSSSEPLVSFLSSMYNPYPDKVKEFLEHIDASINTENFSDTDLSRSECMDLLVHILSDLHDRGRIGVAFIDHLVIKGHVRYVSPSLFRVTIIPPGEESMVLIGTSSMMAELHTRLYSILYPQEEMS